MNDPLRAILAHQNFVVLDGGMGTGLADLGCDLRSDLWSAELLLSDPQGLLPRLHGDFLQAGADSIVAATYQATYQGFRARGLGDRAAEELFRHGVQVALSARDEFVESAAALSGGRPTEGPEGGGRVRPLVAAGIGPYGAGLADGSEYTGDYGLTAAELYDFHARRWEVLAETAVDLMACETTPSVPETQAYCRLAAVSRRPVWISFQCRDSSHLADGAPLREAVAFCEAEPHVVAVGINCVPVELVVPLLRTMRSLTRKPILVYPNSGEVWDPEKRSWTGAADRQADHHAGCSKGWDDHVQEWVREGAAGIGGCCRIGPGLIATVREYVELRR